MNTNSTSIPDHWNIAPDNAYTAIRSDGCQYGAMYDLRHNCWLAAYIPTGDPVSLTAVARAHLKCVSPHWFGGTLNEVCAAIDLAYPMTEKKTELPKPRKLLRKERLQIICACFMGGRFQVDSEIFAEVEAALND